MQKYYLAVDIGASSGRHILFSYRNGRIEMEEIYRFENGMVRDGEDLLWDTERLFKEIVEGMKKCKEIGKIPVSMAIDTWAVDYVLLDENNQVLGKTYGYRDHRTDEIDDEVYKVLSEAELYKRTGIQKQNFNTIYQLAADLKYRPEVLKKAKTFLMLPDYFCFLLTGEKASEYTNATSTQLVNPNTKQWDKELIVRLGLPSNIFLPLQTPGASLGFLKKEIEDQVGYSLEVVQCATHDTASAVMAMPTDSDNSLYISSGTWSLMGVELKNADTGELSHKGNFTNEGGYDYRFRYLKNIMGLWMIQQVRHEENDAHEFYQLADLGKENEAFPSIVDANDSCFLSPESMTEEIKDYCRRNNMEIPETIGQLSAVIYKSLAKCYQTTLEEIEKNTGKHYESINIIGGGCKNVWLNQLTADYTGKRVLAGPSEATAIGNAMVQMIRSGDLPNLKAARKTVYHSFDVDEYIPQR